MKILGITSCDSTNEEIKRRIAQAPEGSPLPPAIAALEQTAGKGRNGRSFSSPYGMGLYLSIPMEVSSMEQALCVTPMAAVCVCKAIEDITGLECGIKWPNDVFYNGRKLCGILTESVLKDTHLYLALGIGINLAQDEEHFPEELRKTAISIKQACGAMVSPYDMANCLVPHIEDMIKALPGDKAEYLEYYRERCITVGKKINVVFAEGLKPRPGEATGIADNFGLYVDWSPYEHELLRNGEVSIR